MKEIFVRPNKYALVDDEDFLYLSGFNWSLNNKGYATTSMNNKHTYMHKIVAKKIGIKDKVDHKDRNKLNNQSDNLRETTISENGANHKLHKNNKSGYSGVHWVKSKNKWRAEITCKYKKIHLGMYLTKEQAAIAYNIKAKELFGDFAVLNEI